MNTFKLNIANSLVVAGLVAISMCMPVVAANLANTANDGAHVSGFMFSAPAQQVDRNIDR